MVSSRGDVRGIGISDGVDVPMEGNSRCDGGAAVVAEEKRNVGDEKSLGGFDGWRGCYPR